MIIEADIDGDGQVDPEMVLGISINNNFVRSILLNSTA